MAIKGLTNQVRAPREAKFKLGYVKRGQRFPSDTDVFVGKVADGITEEMVAAYGATRIPDAGEAGVYSFGRFLRGMLKFEFDTVDGDGREVVYESLNRAWGQSRIRCSGDGGDGGENVGVAWVRDAKYRDRLERAGLLLGDREGGWVASCRGKDCPLWHAAATDSDKLPACHRETRFRFVLLHPATMDRSVSLDQQSDDYLRQLGWVEIATGSWHGAVDITSGMRVMQAEASGRTAFLPFTLKRVMRSISAPSGRVNKATLMVTADTDEVLIFASADRARAQLRPALRRQLAELRQAEEAVGVLGPAQFPDVADIQPQPDRLALPAATTATHQRPEWAQPGDRDEAIDGTSREDDDESEPPTPPVRKLNQPARDELKRLCGGTEDANGRFSNLQSFGAAVMASYEALGVPRDPFAGDLEFVPVGEIREVDRRSVDYLTTVHADWIRHLKEVESGAAQGELLEETGS